ncbi:MAG TPA: hypothetical protein VNV88_02045 [Candidatus Solibacter sp.]|jgi:hypothetical protein|nr:hypothetical protein [Candidatus Solibacter sp.]
MSTRFFSAGQEKKSGLAKAASNAGFAAFIRHEKSGNGYRRVNITRGLILLFIISLPESLRKIVFVAFCVMFFFVPD